VNKYAQAVLINEVLIVLAVVALSFVFGFGWNPLAVLAFGAVGFWLWNTLVSAAIKGYVYAFTPQAKVVNNATITDDDGVH
jgi:hypothetical protein